MGGCFNTTKINCKAIGLTVAIANIACKYLMKQEPTSIFPSYPRAQNRLGLIKDYLILVTIIQLCQEGWSTR